MAITTTTVAAFRKSKAKPADAYIITDAGKPSLWFPAAAGSVGTDNGGTFLRNALGAGIERQYEGLRQASWFGMRGGQDISDAWQRYIDSLSAAEYGTLLVFDYAHYFATGVDLKATGLRLTCLAGMAKIQRNGTGPILRIGNGGSIAELSRLHFLGRGYKEYASKDDFSIDDPKGARYIENALVHSTGRVNSSQCGYEETEGAGLIIEGYQDLNTNGSGSHIHNQNRFVRCSGPGILVYGDNANAVIIEGANDIRNNRWGVVSLSFLGGKIDGNMFHANKERHVITGYNNSSKDVVVNNYFEGDAAKSNSYGGGTFARANRECGTPERGEYADVEDTDSPFVRRDEGYGARGLYAKVGDTTSPIYQYGIAGSTVQRIGSSESRVAPGNWFRTGLSSRSLLWQGVEVDSLEAATKMDYTWWTGDIVQPKQPAGVGLVRVVSGGNGGRTLKGVLASTHPNAGGNLVLSGELDQLVPGASALEAMQTLPTGGLLVAVRGIDKFTSLAFDLVVQIDTLQNDPFSGIRAIGPYQLNRAFDPVPVHFPAPEFAPLPTE